ncbi:MAG TPA: Stp1/IreP family PP2C-type Ser/Thr phosphatase, partial [Candidatus Angelobacter sp.]|nr:Stp1/IreP family PP2C-type Ser/Thr phosphatase [Candidatus Angelobacter sp.]
EKGTSLAFHTRDPHMAFAVEVAGKTDVGCVRANNEDNFGFDSRYGIFVVCDGMGGQAAGEVASKMGVDILLDYFRKETPTVSNPLSITAAGSSGSRRLANAIQLANQTIFHAGQDQNGQGGMGSTIVAALVHGNSLAIANVGDSRIYLIRQGTIQQLTQDHSLVMEQVRRGYITLEQAQKSEMQNIILRALGSEEVVEADVEDLIALPGDLLLMTSDGLTRHVKDEEILEIVQRAADLEQACTQLVEIAKQRGGDDNITCLLVRIVDRPWYRNIVSKLFYGGPQWQNSI